LKSKRWIQQPLEMLSPVRWLLFGVSEWRYEKLADMHVLPELWQLPNWERKPHCLGVGKW
jgi:hypothetical protein